MTQQKPSRIGVVVLLSCVLCAAAPSGSETVLTPTERAAIRAYCVELQKTAGTDTIIDLENPALRDRIQRSSHRQMKSPAIPADLRHQHAHGRVIVGAVVERDATVSHAKVVGPSGYPSFDELARRSVDESSYDEPTKLDGKPVRAFFYAVIDFEAK